MEQYKYMVGVRCFTYNHSRYILDALNGFVMQRTNFPYIVMLVDDASTDGEQEVIRNFVAEQFDIADTNVAYEKETDYSHITYAQHNTNKNCYIVAMYLKENHYSQRKSKIPYLSEWRDYVKYEALCEGDDYWIHPQKLQMQADFLEENEEYSMCFHGAEILNCRTIYDNRCLLYKNLDKREYQASEIFNNWLIPTASVVYRSNVKRISDCRFIVGDNPLFLSCAKVGKIYCISNKNMSVYRINDNSVVSKGLDWKKQIEHYEAISENFGSLIDNKIINNKKAVTYVYAFCSEKLNIESFNILKKIFLYDIKILPKFITHFINIICNKVKKKK